ncbi:MAG: glycosyltransferase family 2 protein [Terracidiphilus sp.]
MKLALAESRISLSELKVEVASQWDALSLPECGPPYSNSPQLTPLRISVALCTCNGERYLQEQLKSISAQTRLPDEVVICDDNSADSTREILSSFAASAPFRVRVEHNLSRLGSTHNFERAIRFCTGDLIALCDQDDMWGAEKLSIQAARFENDPAIGGLFSNAALIDSESNSIGRTLWQSIDFSPVQQRLIQAGQAVNVLLSQSVVTGATLMFRAEFIPIFCPIPSSWVHDGWIAWVIALRSKLDLVPEPLISYRIHSIQQCGVLPSVWNRINRRQTSATLQYLATAHQLRDLCQYLYQGGDAIHSRSISLLEKKIQHLNLRASLPKNRFMRFIRIFPEMQNYWKFSKGWKSLSKDIIIRQ